MGLKRLGPFKNSDCAKPHSPYAKSKYDAEMALKKIFSATDSELVIIRPPMIYGIGAPGNFSLISKFIRNNIPLPLRGISNRHVKFHRFRKLHKFGGSLYLSPIGAKENTSGQ